MPASYVATHNFRWGQQYFTEGQPISVQGWSSKALGEALRQGLIMVVQTPDLSGKQDAATAATDTELASGLATKQDAATAATDTELSTGLAGKQDASTAATDAELAAAVAAKKRTWDFREPGVLAVKTGVLRLYNRTGATISLAEMFAVVGTAPAGAAITLALAKDGTAVAGAGVSIAAAANTGSVLGPFTWENGTYLTLNITAVGSTTAGADLVVTLTET